MQKKLFRFRDLTISYRVYGNGKKSLIAFHGFDQSTSTYAPLFESLSLKNYTTFSIGLFFHESLFPAERLPHSPLEISEFTEMIEAFRVDQKIYNYSLLANSMGCRLCFQLLKSGSSEIEKVVLMAPDGIIKNRWYDFFVNTGAGRLLFSLSIEHFTTMISFATLLHKVGIIRKHEYKLAQYALESEASIQKVRNTWLAYRKIYPSLLSWINYVSVKGENVRFYFGKYDRVIGEKPITALRNLLKNQDCIEILPIGHNFEKAEIRDKVVRFLG